MVSEILDHQEVRKCKKAPEIYWCHHNIHVSNNWIQKTTTTIAHELNFDIELSQKMYGRKSHIVEGDTRFVRLGSHSTSGPNLTCPLRSRVA